MGLLPLGFDRLAPVGREIHGVVAQLARQFQDTSLGRFDGQWQHRPLQIHRLHDHQNLDGRHRRRTGLLYDGSRSHSALADVGDGDHLRRRLRHGSVPQPVVDRIRLVPSLYHRHVHRRREPALRLRHRRTQRQQRFAQNQRLGTLGRLARQFRTWRQGFQLQRQSDGMGCPHMGDRIHQPDGRTGRLLRRQGAGRNLGLPRRRSFPRSGRHRLARRAVVLANARQGDPTGTSQIRRPESGR